MTARSDTKRRQEEPRARLSSREIPRTSGRRRVDTTRKATSGGTEARASSESCAVYDPGTWGHILHGSWEVPGSPANSQCSRGASGSSRTGADDERTREVGQTHSTGEVSEQSRATSGGGDGGKESGQGESGPANRDPDSEPGSRAK